MEPFGWAHPLFMIARVVVRFGGFAGSGGGLAILN